jgi:hypothetical protein
MYNDSRLESNEAQEKLMRAGEFGPSFCGFGAKFAVG